MRAGTLFRILLLILLVLLVLQPHLFEGFFALFARPAQPVIYNQGSLLDIVFSHLAIVGIAMFFSAALAIGLAILVTRPFGSEFLPVTRAVANMGQTFPPVAVLALAVPMLGFGTAPTLVALFLYGLLPIFENTLAGLTNVPPDVTEAARGSGMTPAQLLVHVELPLALPLILAGIRLSTVIAMGTATIGSTVAARTLGEVIIAGLLSNNTAFVLQGAIIVGALSLLIYDTLAMVEARLSARMARSTA